MTITLKKETEITGNGLMKNKPCKVKFFPSDTGKIRYFVSGEEINLDRYAIFGSFFLADYQVKILVYYRQTA